MQNQTLVSVEEYLDTVYRPDCDLVDGMVLERNLGELSHARLQSLISSWFYARENQLGIKVVVELRVRVAEKRFRIPDITILHASAPREEVIVTPPRLCIEILSPRDSLNQIWDRTQDYLAMGVQICWIIDPLARRAWVARSDGLVEAKDGVLRSAGIEMPLDEVFE